MLPLLLLAAAAPNACSLLTGKEIAAIQGESPTDAKLGTSDQGALQISNCVFVLPTASNSVSLELVSGSGQAARNRWKEIFHPKRGEKEKGEEGEQVAPRRIRSLGEEAFWLSEKPSGALYVLRKRSFLRLSIGGPDPRHDKLARARSLLKKALRRL